MIGVVGGNLAGLAAAYRLTRRGYDVRVFEAGDDLGGIAATTGTGEDSVERVPASFSRPTADGALEVLADLGLDGRLEWNAVRTAMYHDGTVHPVDAPWEVLAYPPLSLFDTARLAAVRRGIDLGGVPRRLPSFGLDDRAAFADVTAERFLREHATDYVYDRFYEPILEARFGPRAPSVSASWLLSQLRDDRERTRAGREIRGTLIGGTGVLVDALVDAVGPARIATNVAATEVVTADGAVESIALEGADAVPVDAVVLATAPARLAALTGYACSLPVQTRTCVRLTTAASVTDVDRIAMVDDAPFGELVARPPGERDAEGPTRYYLLDGGEAYERGLSTETVERRWLEAFSDRFPAFDRADLAGVDAAQVDQPVYEPGFGDALVPADLSAAVADGVYYAGVGSEPHYPERTIGGALEAGLRCGARLRPTAERGVRDEVPERRRSATGRAAEKRTRGTE